jgi:hypothetical protein
VLSLLGEDRQGELRVVRDLESVRVPTVSVGESGRRNDVHLIASGLLRQFNLELYGFEVMGMPPQTDVLGVVEEVSQDHLVDLLEEVGVVFLGKADFHSAPIGDLGDLVIDDRSRRRLITGMSFGDGPFLPLE